ncbi:hypothetical protein B6U81_07080 [Thermoplasmatales archaeon ex4484_30]|nr:MAG: hypothetical protein B6U81_07080 [Thermoplasmatales archaeon ex4484_30]
MNPEKPILPQIIKHIEIPFGAKNVKIYPLHHILFHWDMIMKCKIRIKDSMKLFIHPSGMNIE